MRTSKFIKSPYLEMKLLTNDEFQQYKNHNCQEYVRQGKTFNYDKMALLNKRYLEPKSEQELETSASQSPEQADTAGNSAEPVSQNDDAVISQQENNVNMNDSNSDNVQAVPSINIDDNTPASINTSNIQEAKNENDSQQGANTSITLPPADPVTAGNVIQGKKKFKGQIISSPIIKPYICSHCNKGYTTSFTLKRHISQIHNNDWKPSQKKDVKRLQSPNKKPVSVKNALPKSTKDKTVFLPIPVPTPVSVKYPTPVEEIHDLTNRKPKKVSAQNSNSRKRTRKILEESDDEYDNLEPPAKSFVKSKRAPTRSKNNDDDEAGYNSL